MYRIGRLFVIKTRLEAMAVIYALALGAIERGLHYCDQYPGAPGYLLLLASTVAVFMAGARLMEFTRTDNGERRRRSDWLPERERRRSVHRLKLSAAEDR